MIPFKSPHQLSDEIGRVKELMNQEQNVPMSLADGCLVMMSQLIKGSCVLTLGRALSGSL